MRVHRGIATLATLAFTTALFAGAAVQAEHKTLSIGLLGPVSGGAASYGVELLRGAELRVEEINKAGGLKVGTDTYRIKLVSYDHKA
ncbi:MAG TPA: ABC transporter substrate-binding protein, partial [Methylomirabilota bacterium]|nr:ABC transporter substrate-binding protein [Methylomirabilota bacterium]